MSIILGLNAYHAGSSACLVIDGEPIAAIAEERLNRVKYFAGFPTMAVSKCLEMGGVQLRDVDHVAVGRDSSANLAKKIEFALKNPTKLFNLVKRRRTSQKLDDLKAIMARECGVSAETLKFQPHFVEHHLAHIASAYFASPWDRAAGISIDGSGDFVTTMMADCQGDEINVKHRVFVPHSIGWLYIMVCQFIGYEKYGDEGKVMGLAPFGKPTYLAELEKAVILKPKGFELNPKYFRPFADDQGFEINEKGEMIQPRIYSDAMIELFGEPRKSDAEISQRDMDLAYSLQQVFEKVYMHLLNELYKMVPVEKLVMAGGCVLNSVANGKLFDQTPFRETCIQPAAGDEGLSLGAALYVARSVLKEKKRYVMSHSYLGPEYPESEMKAVLDRLGVAYQHCQRDQLLDETAGDIEQGRVVGWFQGAMEWGPRALGNRSILTHPGLPNMKDVLNARIKRREWYRPFAPVVLTERQNEIFEHDHPSPFMLHVYKIRPEWREKLCAVNHVDDTGRLQTVARHENPLYYDLVQAFEKRTGIPVLLNTSFNENEPICCTPEEAIECFLRTKMDTLVIGPFVCRKEAQLTPMVAESAMAEG